MTDLTRRSFLGGALAITAASIVLFKKSMDPVGSPLPRIVGDGIHDDTLGLQAALDGKPFICDGQVVRGSTMIFLKSGTYRYTNTLRMGDCCALVGEKDHKAMLLVDHNETGLVCSGTDNRLENLYFNRPQHYTNTKPEATLIRYFPRFPVR